MRTWEHTDVSTSQTTTGLFLASISVLAANVAALGENLGTAVSVLTAVGTFCLGLASVLRQVREHLEQRKKGKT